MYLCFTIPLQTLRSFSKQNMKSTLKGKQKIIQSIQLIERIVVYCPITILHYTNDKNRYTCISKYILHLLKYGYI